MTESDLSAVERIEKASFPAPWTTASLKAACREDLALVAETEGAVAGFLFARPALDEAELFTLAVDLPFRRTGVAKALIDALHEILKHRGCEKLFLEVRVSNTAARGLYEKSGFRPVSTRKGYYADNEDAVIMAVQIV